MPHILKNDTKQTVQEITFHEETKKFIPVFKCTMYGDGGWTFHCPICRRGHYHLAGEGFRQARCNGINSFRGRGYYLVQKETGGVNDARNR